MLGGKKLSDVPGNLREFAFASAIKLKGFIIDLFDTQIGLLIILIIIGILMYYILRYLIGLKIGNEYFKNKEKKKQN